MRPVHLLLAIILVDCWLSPLASQEPLRLFPAASDAPRVADATTDEKRQEVAIQLKAANLNLQEAKSQTNGKDNSTEQAAKQVESLTQQDSIIAQQQIATKSHDELAARQEDLQKQLQQLLTNGPTEKQPYSFLLLDRSRDELEDKTSRKESVDAKIAAAQVSVQIAKKLATERENARLLTKEAFERATDEVKKAELNTAFLDAEQQAKVAAETLKLEEQKLANEKLSGQVYDSEVELLKARISAIEKNADFTKSDLESQLLEIEKREKQVESSIKSVELTLNYLDQQWMKQRQVVDQTGGDKTLVEAELEAVRRERQSRQAELAFLNWQRPSLADDKKIWQTRFKIRGEVVPFEELKQLESQYKQALEQLARERSMQLLTHDDLNKDLQTIDTRLQAVDPQQAPLAVALRRQADAVRENTATLDSFVASIDARRRLIEKLLSEIGVETKSVTAYQWIEQFWDRVLAVWNYVAFSEGENPITVGKIIKGLILFFLGFWLSGIASRLIGRRLLPRVGLNTSAATALQSVAFYILFAIFTLMALRLVNVPLTVFTFLGGAVAIGLGFGSQNIINNFISGLILLAERPIRVGDNIQLESLMGTVQKIGPRSTMVRTQTNVEIIIPNSSFLENNVINWTLSDRRIRTSISVGVSYGSPTREVAKLLKYAADEHGKILGSPAPIVWFADFGDNSLVFELHVWIQMRDQNERRQIESDLRFQIDNLFNEAGIVIAFPQRDVHLNISEPLQVRLLTETPPQASEAA